MVGGGASCRSGYLGILLFESVSVSIKALPGLIPSPLLHAGEQCSVANDSDSERGRARLSTHKVQKTAHRLSISDDADIRGFSAWSTGLNSKDQCLQWRSRSAIGILINKIASSVWLQGWTCLRRIPDWWNAFRSESQPAKHIVDRLSATDLVLGWSALAHPASCRSHSLEVEDLGSVLAVIGRLWLDKIDRGRHFLA